MEEINKKVMVINKHHVRSPIEIVTTTLGIPEDYKQQCIQEAYKIGNSISNSNNYTNVNAIRSTYKLWEETNIYNLLLEKIERSIDIIFPILDNRFKYNLKECWSIIYKEGHYANTHKHLPFHTSFVYYLKSNNNSSPLIFDKCDFQLQPHDDLLVVFPSYLVHSVPRHKGEDRICIAGNLDWV